MRMPAPVKSQVIFLRTVPVMTVNDPERSLAFFTLLGFQVRHRETRFAIITLDALKFISRIIPRCAQRKIPR
jgi:hypothetical protein